MQLEHRIKIDTVFSEEYYADTSTASMRKLPLVARDIEKKGYANLIEPEECDIEGKLKELHDPHYVECFRKGVAPLCSSQGWRWTEGIRNGVFAINKGQITAAKLALANGISANVAQGFHHACYDRGGGFCTFNGLALVAQELAPDKVFILDCDEHGGNGTEDFIVLGNLYQATIHGSPFGCKGIKGKSECFAIRNDFKAYRRALETSFSMILNINPALVIYQAGVDCHVDDPLGSVGLSTGEMRERDRIVFEFLSKRGIPTMFVLAGGYQEPIETKLLPLHVNTFEEASITYSFKKNKKELLSVN